MTVQLSGPGFTPRETGAVLEEISTSSACLQLEEPVPLETAIRFLFTESAEGKELAGTVVKCVHQPALGFFAEVRFAKGCTWSPKRYRPLHLFDPVALLAAARETASEV